MDIAFDLKERDHHGHRQFYYRGAIDDVGDLSYQRGYEELPPQGLTVEIGYAYPQIFENMDALKQVDPTSLLQQGFLVVRVRSCLL